MMVPTTNQAEIKSGPCVECGGRGQVWVKGDTANRCCPKCGGSGQRTLRTK